MAEWTIEDIVAIVLSQIFLSEFVHSIAQGMKVRLPVFVTFKSCRYWIPGSGVSRYIRNSQARFESIKERIRPENQDACTSSAMRTSCELSDPNVHLGVLNEGLGNRKR